MWGCVIPGASGSAFWFSSELLVLHSCVSPFQTLTAQRGSPIYWGHLWIPELILTFFGCIPDSGDCWTSQTHLRKPAGSYGVSKPSPLIFFFRSHAIEVRVALVMLTFPAISISKPSLPKPTFIASNKKLHQVAWCFFASSIENDYVSKTDAIS